MCNPQTLNCGHTFCRYVHTHEPDCKSIVLFGAGYTYQKKLRRQHSTSRVNCSCCSSAVAQPMPAPALQPAMHNSRTRCTGRLCAGHASSDTLCACPAHACRECVVDTLEGPGIVKSQCPICKQPAWKKELKTNHKYLGLADAAAQLTALLQQQGRLAHKPGTASKQEQQQQLDAAQTCGRRKRIPAKVY